jgi:hypothetical protein
MSDGRIPPGTAESDQGPPRGMRSYSRDNIQEADQDAPFCVEWIP